MEMGAQVLTGRNLYRWTSATRLVRDDAREHIGPLCSRDGAQPIPGTVDFGVFLAESGGHDRLQFAQDAIRFEMRSNLVLDLGMLLGGDGVRRCPRHICSARKGWRTQAQPGYRYHGSVKVYYRGTGMESDRALES